MRSTPRISGRASCPYISRPGPVRIGVNRRESGKRDTAGADRALHGGQKA